MKKLKKVKTFSYSVVNNRFQNQNFQKKKKKKKL